MYVPGLKERVCQRGCPGLFLVVWVDCDRQTADLIRLDTDRAWLEEGVPFQEIQPGQEGTGASRQLRTRSDAFIGETGVD